MAKYCRYCGKSLLDDTIFCSSCGKKQSLENNMDADNQENMNTTTHSSSKNQVLVNLAECFETFNKMMEKYDVRNSTLVYISNKVSYIWVFIFFIGAGFLIGNWLDYFFWTLKIQMLGVTSCWVGIGLILPYCIVNWHKNRVKNCKSILETTTIELQEYYKNQKLPIALSFEYSDPRIINLIIDVLKQGRADSLKEAINCVVNDQLSVEALKLHKKKSDSNNLDSIAILALGIELGKNV